MSADPIRFYGRQGPCPWLSNFAFTPIVDTNGQLWRTAEHAYQAMKFTDPVHRAAVHQAETPAAAKQLGRSFPLRPDWEGMKVDVMRRVLSRKFCAGSELAGLLLETSGRALIEDSPTDFFWGIGRDQSGRNMLGFLLEERRAWLEEHGRAQA